MSAGSSSPDNRPHSFRSQPTPHQQQLPLLPVVFSSGRWDGWMCDDHSASDVSIGNGVSCRLKDLLFLSDVAEAVAGLFV